MALQLQTGGLYHLSLLGAEKIVRATYKGSAGGSAHWFSIEGDETFLYESNFVVLGIQETLS